MAYRFFSTERRKFIVADTPGHEQYTRNMVTGASTADVAVILVDARKGMLTQTRRHSYLVSLLGIKRVVVAINKMDLVDYSEDTFGNIAEEYLEFAGRIGLDDVTFIPLSALRGDNIIELSANTPWYHGPTLLGYLETVPVDDEVADGPFRMPVQWVNRPNLDFRGFSGRIVGGTIRPGDPIRVLPSGTTSVVERIVTMDGDLDEAIAGQSVTLTLADEIDASRGDVICAAESPTEVADQFEAHVVWMHEDAMLPGRPYLMKIGARTVGATLGHPKYRVDINNLDHLAATTLELNEIGVCNVSLDRPIPFDPYADNRDMGGFIVIDKLTNVTVGAGLLHFALRRSHNIHWQDVRVDKAARAAQSSHRPAVVWLTGLSGAGKSTIANIVESKLHTLGRADLPARRRQRPPRPEPRPRLHRRRPCGEHPPHRRGVGPHGRRRSRGAGVVHLPVPRRTPTRPRLRRGRRVHRGPRRHAARRRRGARPEGSLRQGAPRRADELHRHRLALRTADRSGVASRHRRDHRRGRRRGNRRRTPRARHHQLISRRGGVPKLTHFMSRR